MPVGDQTYVPRWSSWFSGARSCHLQLCNQPFWVPQMEPAGPAVWGRHSCPARHLQVGQTPHLSVELQETVSTTHWEPGKLRRGTSGEPSWWQLLLSRVASTISTSYIYTLTQGYVGRGTSFYYLQSPGISIELPGPGKVASTVTSTVLFSCALDWNRLLKRFWEGTSRSIADSLITLQSGMRKVRLIQGPISFWQLHISKGTCVGVQLPSESGNLKMMTWSQKRQNWNWEVWTLLHRHWIALSMDAVISMRNIEPTQIISDIVSTNLQSNENK